MSLNCPNIEPNSQSTTDSNYFLNMTNSTGFDSIPRTTSTFGLSGHNLFQPFHLLEKSFSMNQIGNIPNYSSFSNPLFYNLAAQSQSTQFPITNQLADIDQIMRNPGSIQLFNTLLQQQPSNSSNFLTPNKTSILLMEQQNREAEAHRMQFLDFQSLHTNSSLISVNSRIVGNKMPIYDEMLETLPVVNCNESQKPNRIDDLPGTIQSTDQVFGVLPQTPYYPTHFMRGTVLQTTNDSKKLVETLNAEDFSNLGDIAKQTHDMNLCIGLVVDLKQIDSSARQSTVHFETESQLENGDLEISTCELDNPVEYPFFELTKRWCSVNPIKTQNLYGLECSQLEIGDRCIVLAAFQEQPTNSNQNQMAERRLSPILESNQSDSQLSIASETSSRRVSYFCDSNVEMDDHVVI